MCKPRHDKTPHDMPCFEVTPHHITSFHGHFHSSFLLLLLPTDDFDDDAYVMTDDAGIINVDKEEQFESCVYHYMTSYLNRADVKAALHVPLDITVRVMRLSSCTCPVIPSVS